MTFAPPVSPGVHEAEVAARFDALRARFKNEVAGDDFRLQALVSSLAPLAGKRVLDLGCGKGRFALRLQAQGARVIGLDLSGAMLREASGLDRIRATARRLPLADHSFDAVVAVEVFEHLPPAGVDCVLAEALRVLKPSGILAIVDKNARSWNPIRPWLPSLVVKWIDERRGRWMYPARGLVRERWLWPGPFRKRLARSFSDVRIAFLRAPDEEAALLFRLIPSARKMTLWTARAPGGRERGMAS
jgi:2-polyprenyl-6-hydroxyphenyl methylase/3-demethylubiquinone-9 3-methyltransferase